MKIDQHAQSNQEKLENSNSLGEDLGILSDDEGFVDFDHYEPPDEAQSIVFCKDEIL